MRSIHALLFLCIFSFGFHTKTAHAAFENPVARGFVMGGATVGIASVTALAGGFTTIAIHADLYDSMVVGIAVGGLLTPVGSRPLAIASSCHVTAL